MKQSRLLGLLKLENNMLSELLVVLSELKLLSSSEILLLDICDVAHDTGFGRDARHICAFSFCHT